MQYRLRTLLIVLALGPPVLGISTLFAQSNPFLAIFTIAWSVAFFVAVTSQAERQVGLTLAEWLVVLAIVVFAARLLIELPTAQRE